MFQDVYLLSYVLLKAEYYYKIYVLKPLSIYKCLFLYTSSEVNLELLQHPSIPGGTLCDNS